MHTNIHGPMRAVVLSFIFVTAVSAFAEGDTKEAWSQHCAKCHGADGTANTKMGRKLSIKDLTQQRVQTRLTDDRIEEAITEGVRDDEGKEEMPAFREKLPEPTRKALIAFVRSLRK